MVEVVEEPAAIMVMPSANALPVSEHTRGVTMGKTVRHTGLSEPPTIGDTIVVVGGAERPPAQQPSSSAPGCADLHPRCEVVLSSPELCAEPLVRVGCPVSCGLCPAAPGGGGAGPHPGAAAEPAATHRPRSPHRRARWRPRAWPRRPRVEAWWRQRPGQSRR